MNKHKPKEPTDGEKAVLNFFAKKSVGEWIGLGDIVNGCNLKKGIVKTALTKLCQSGKLTQGSSERYARPY